MVKYKLEIEILLDIERTSLKIIEILEMNRHNNYGNLHYDQMDMSQSPLFKIF